MAIKVLAYVPGSVVAMSEADAMNAFRRFLHPGLTYKIAIDRDRQIEVDTPEFTLTITRTEGR